jgi:transposase
MIAELSDEIRKAYRAIEARIAERYPEARALQQVTGVGPLTALAFVLTLENPMRFRRSRQVGAYLGLTPRQRDSGSRSPQLRISKAGDGYLRRLLISCSQYILGPFGPDSDLRRWGMDHGANIRGKSRKRAVVGVARRLAVLLHHLWATGEVYEPVRRGLPMPA